MQPAGVGRCGVLGVRDRPQRVLAVVRSGLPSGCDRGAHGQDRGFTWEQRRGCDEGPDRDTRSRRDHRRRPSGRPYDTGVRGPGDRQDTARRGVPRARRERHGRARRVHVVRGDERRAQAERRVARLRPRRAGTRRPGEPRPRAHAPRRDRGNRRIRSRGPVRAPRLCDRLDQRQAGRTRHPGGALLCALEPVHPARRGPSAVSLAQRPRHDGARDGGAWRGPAHAPRAGGVRLGLRAAARQPR